MKPVLRKITRALSSLRLTMIIITASIIAIIPATLIVQNRNEAFYMSSYPSPLGYLILACGYDRFYSSPFFLFLLGIFWLNLFFCTLKRFRGQLKSKGRGQFGPDILHLGILIMVIAAMVSFSTGRKGSLYLQEGNGIQLPSGRFMFLEEFVYEQYPDGRPKSWISRVEVTDTPEEEGREYLISVNHPLRIDGLAIYQTGYRPSEQVGKYEPGLMITSDPGRIYVRISFLIIIIGLMITLIQKRRKT